MRHPKSQHYYQQVISFSELQELHDDGAIVDGRLGGLILGPSHAEGGIYFMFAYSYGFVLFGEVEGYEFIVNRESNAKNKSEIARINNIQRDASNDFAPFFVDDSIRTIDARCANPKYAAKYILLDMLGGFAIVNKHSTKLHLDKLNLINQMQG